jgi:hypothetical protein
MNECNLKHFSGRRGNSFVDPLTLLVNAEVSAHPLTPSQIGYNSV